MSSPMGHRGHCGRGFARGSGHRRFDPDAIRAFESFVSSRRFHDGRSGFGGHRREGLGDFIFMGFGGMPAYGDMPHLGNMGPQAPPPPFPPMFGPGGMPGFGGGRRGFGHGRGGFGGRGGHHHFGNHFGGRGGMQGFGHRGGFGGYGMMGFEEHMRGHCMRGRGGGRGGMGRGGRMPQGGRSLSEPPSGTRVFATGDL
ncbi:hypothetical protein EIP86_010717 [Pleurotus ostreatoroseus]|nr:hypothetical protein EIP86_010717 [Pleurotus ostreatoroseus]